MHNVDDFKSIRLHRICNIVFFHIQNSRCNKISIVLQIWADYRRERHDHVCQNIGNNDIILSVYIKVLCLLDRRTVKLEGCSLSNVIICKQIATRELDLIFAHMIEFRIFLTCPHSQLINIHAMYKACSKP